MVYLLCFDCKQPRYGPYRNHPEAEYDHPGFTRTHRCVHRLEGFYGWCHGDHIPDRDKLMKEIARG